MSEDHDAGCRHPARLPARRSASRSTPSRRRCSRSRWSASSCRRRGGWSWQAWIPLGPLADFPESQTRLATYRNPVLASVGRRDGEHPLLGAAHLGRRVPGLRHQLHASRLPGALVPGVGPVHVPVPRRRLLRRRRARLGAAAARRSTSTSTRSRTASSGCAAASCRRCSESRADGALLRDRSAPGSTSASGLGAPLAEVGAHRVPRDTASWWYVFGSATLVVLRPPDRDRHLPRAGLRAVGRRRLAEPRCTSTTSSRSAGSCARCTAGARTSWSR